MVTKRECWYVVRSITPIQLVVIQIVFAHLTLWKSTNRTNRLLLFKERPEPVRRFVIVCVTANCQGPGGGGELLRPCLVTLCFTGFSKGLPRH